MNYKEAKEIVDCRERTICKHQSIDVARAECYLKAHAKAQKLVEALEEIKSYPPETNHGEFAEELQEIASKALSEWHKENKEGE